MTTTASADRPLHLAGERLPFAMLPRWLLYHSDANEGAKFLYCVLHDLVQGREGPTRPVTRAELAAACGVSPDTIDRRLAQLVAVGAVEKEHQIRAGGQQANVYRVWLTPPDGLQRAEAVEMRGRVPAAPVEGSANPQVNRSRESAAPPPVPHLCGTGGRNDAAPNKKEELEEVPPQPPRPAGGHDASELIPAPAQPAATRRSRAAGTNPRAEADRAEAARLEAEAARRQAELEARTEARRAADRRAELEAQRLEAEASSFSAALDDDTLTAVVAHVTAGMSGLLAGSAVAVSRAVVAWCRAAAANSPGPFTQAVATGLANGIAAGKGSAPLDLPAPPTGTAPLRTRIAGILKTKGGV